MSKLGTNIFDRVHRSFFLLLLLHAFRQILIFDTTFMLLMSANICPMSPHVPTCPHMSPHVPTCPQMSHHVPTCPQMSPNVLKCPENVQKMSAMHSVEFLSWIRKPESFILDKKTGKSDLV